MIEIRDGQIVTESAKEIMDGQYLTMREFAEKNGVSYELVRQWKRRGKIVTVSLYGRDYIDAKVQIRKGKVGRPPKRPCHNL